MKNIYDIELTKKALFKDINKLIYEIRNCKSKSRYTFLIEELKKIYYICDTLCITDYPKIDLFSAKNYKIDYSKLPKRLNNYLIKNYKYYLDFSKNIKNFDIEYYNNEKMFIINNTVKIKDNIDLMYEFLDSYNKDIYNLLKNIIEADKLIINDETKVKNNLEEINKNDNNISISAFTFYFNRIEVPYIFLNKDEYIFFSIFLSHELGHCYEKFITKFKTSKSNQGINHFEEVFSHYIEFIYIDYLLKNRIYIEDIENVKNGLNFELVCELYELNKYLNNPHIKNYDEIISNLNYSFGLTLAYHFYDMYLTDPEKAEYDIKQFIQLSNYYDNIELLEKMNLKNEIIDSKILKKYLKNN